MNPMHWYATSAFQNHIFFCDTPDGGDDGLLSLAILKHDTHLVLFKISEGRSHIQFVTKLEATLRGQMHFICGETKSFDGFLFNIMYHGRVDLMGASTRSSED